MVRVLFLFLIRFHVNVARSNGNLTWRANLVPRGRDPFGQRRGSGPLGTRLVARQKLTHAYYASASYLRREGHLYEDASYLRTGVKGCSYIRRVLAKLRLILDEMCRLYGKFASYSRRVFIV